MVFFTNNFWKFNSNKKKKKISYDLVNYPLMNENLDSF